MFENSDLIVTAWNENKLVGVSSYNYRLGLCSYLADLAVSPATKDQGSAKKLIELARGKNRRTINALLLSVPTAMDYYPKIGLRERTGLSIMHRTK